MRKINDSILNIRLGAIYRFAAGRRLPRENVTALLKERAQLSQNEAAILCGHWFTTRHFRAA